MSDIVERLRKWNADENEFKTRCVIEDAADEIERLRGQTATLRQDIEQLSKELARSLAHGRV